MTEVDSHSDFHQSFKEVDWLAEGPFFVSDQFPEHVVRQSIFSERDGADTLHATARLMQQQIQDIRAHGVYVVDVYPFIARGNGGELVLNIACDRLHGRSLDVEISLGNTAAIRAYGDTLVSIANYYIDAHATGRTVMGDVVGTHQYTWEDNGVVLHDISTDANDAQGWFGGEEYQFRYPRFRSTMIFISEDLVVHRRNFTPQQVDDLQAKLASMLAIVEQHRLKHSEDPLSPEEFFVRLVLQAQDNQAVQQTLLEALRSSHIELNS